MIRFLFLDSFWNRLNFHDTIVYINNAIPEENYKLMMLLYKIRNSSLADSVVSNDVLD